MQVLAQMFMRMMLMRTMRWQGSRNEVSAVAPKVRTNVA
jgi:hypothetical protein